MQHRFQSLSFAAPRVFGQRICAVALRALFVACVLPPSCAPTEARSLDGRALAAPQLGKAKRARLERDLDEARERMASQPDSVDAAVWVGRRLAYLGRYREAIEWYTMALARFGPQPALLRHRGHRLVTVRSFAQAESDLARAMALCDGRPDETEVDGIPTAGGPRTTLQGNIAYHLALAQFCQGKFDDAAASWRRALELATNDDADVSARYWLAVTEFERGKPEMARAVLAPLREAPPMDIRENHSYHRLALALRGDIAIDSLQAADGPLGVGVDRATLGFGRAMHARHIAGSEREAQAILRETARLDEWAAFGVIASEATLARARPM